MITDLIIQYHVMERIPASNGRKKLEFWTTVSNDGCEYSVDCREAEVRFKTLKKQGRIPKLVKVTIETIQI